MLRRGDSFPESAIDMKFFIKSDHHTTWPWKGEASYYDIEADGKINENVAWYYAEPKDAAKILKATWHSGKAL